MLHDFVFTNTGNATLEIKSVTPSCGCTTAGEWTHLVEPGHTGQISLQFDTKRFNGRVTEVTAVASNDRAHYKVTLAFTGTVWRPIDIKPWTVILKPTMDSGIGASNTSEIINHMIDPITVGTPASDNPAFTAELKTIVPGREFRLVVHSNPINRSTMIHGNITMRTSSDTAPSITVSAMVIPQAPLVVSPAFISLPSGPLAAPTHVTVSFLNNGTHLIKLTEATTDVAGVEVGIKELQPGREFTLNLFFPAGSQLPEDREATLTIMTSNPKTPSFKVPMRPVKPSISRTAALPQSAPHRN